MLLFACASPRWEPCASHPPGTRKACWEKPCAPEGQQTSLSAASCRARSSQQRATKKNKHSTTQFVDQQIKTNRLFSLYVTELCLFSPWFGPWRQSVSQKKQVRPSAGSSSGPGWSSPSCPCPPSQTVPCTGLRSGPPRCPPACGSPALPAGEKHTRLRAEGEFPQCVRVSVYFFCSAGSRWKWRFRCDQLCHPEGNKKHVFRTLTSHSVGVRLAL